MLVLPPGPEPEMCDYWLAVIRGIRSRNNEPADVVTSKTASSLLTNVLGLGSCPMVLLGRRYSCADQVFVCYT